MKQDTEIRITDGLPCIILGMKVTDHGAYATLEPLPHEISLISEVVQRLMDSRGKSLLACMLILPPTTIE